MVILHSGVPCSLARHGVGPFSSRKKIYKSVSWAGAYQSSSSLHLVGCTYFQCSLKLEGWSRHVGHVLFYAYTIIGLPRVVYNAVAREETVN